jgi:N-acetylglucosaminyl-diphospho-decaprenol L-rhamnosyltransferase
MPILSYSVVVVTWNSGPELPPLLTSIREQLGDDVEVIVVDNSSSDETSAVARAARGVRLVPLGENRGFGSACNVGVREARSDVVVLLNADTKLVDASLVGLVALASQTGAICAPELLNEDLSRQPSASPIPGGWEVGLDAVAPASILPHGLRIRCEPWRAERRVGVGWLTGACVVAKREVFLRLGPFDERIHLYGEDMDLGVRARKAGVASIYAPDVARVVHLGDRSAARRYADAGLAASIVNRRRIVRLRFGRGRACYDFVGQVVYHALRYAVKRVVGRDFGREERWLRTMARVARSRGG